jgi:hypothetical protein
MQSEPSLTVGLLPRLALVPIAYVGNSVVYVSVLNGRNPRFK